MKIGDTATLTRRFEADGIAEFAGLAGLAEASAGVPELDLFNAFFARSARGIIR